MKKKIKSEVNYIENAKYNWCITCIHWQGKFCSEVKGQINRHGSCNYWGG